MLLLFLSRITYCQANLDSINLMETISWTAKTTMEMQEFWVVCSLNEHLCYAEETNKDVSKLVCLFTLQIHTTACTKTRNTWSVKQDNNTKFNAPACSGVPDFNNTPPQHDNLQSLPTPNEDKVVKTLNKNLVFNCDHQFYFWSEHI